MNQKPVSAYLKIGSPVRRRNLHAYLLKIMGVSSETIYFLYPVS